MTTPSAIVTTEKKSEYFETLAHSLFLFRPKRRKRNQWRSSFQVRAFKVSVSGMHNKDSFGVESGDEGTSTKCLETTL